MKKLIGNRYFLVLVACLIILPLVIAGCGGSKKAENKGTGEKVTIKIAYENNPGEPIDLAVKEWARVLKERTNGQMELQLYPSSQLGSKKDIMEQMKLGSNIITIGDGGFFADYVPDFGILMGPYLGKDYKDIFKLSKTEWFADLSKKLEGKGYHILTSNWLYGTRHMVTTKPVNTPADLQGLKIRVPNNKIQIEAMKAMGATPTPMPLAEVYPALTQGVINGAENPIPVMYGQKHHEPAKYLIMTGHLDNVSQWICGQKFFEKLSPENQKALQESGDIAGVFMTTEIEKAEKVTIDKMKSEGVTVIDVDRNLFREASKSTYEKFPDWTPGLYEKVQGLIK